MELDRADVVVVGAGIAGLSTAHALSERGFAVVVVDQRFAAFGASGRNPGCLWVQSARAGTELQVAKRALDIYAQHAEELGDSFDFHRSGGVLFYTTDAQKVVLGEYVSDRQEHGVDIEFISTADAREKSEFVPDDALGAVYCPHDAQVDTAKYTRALAEACRRRGISIYENTPVLGVTRQGGDVNGVRTVRGNISAGGVVWAIGAWASGTDFEGVHLPITPIRMGMLITQPTTRRTSVIVHGPEGVTGMAALSQLPGFDADIFQPGLTSLSGLGYEDIIVQRGDGSLVVGHTHDPASSLNPHITLDATRLLLDATLRRHPELATLGAVGLWAGLVGTTADQVPIIDRFDGIYLNTAHVAGAASGPVSGELTAQLVAGETPSVPIDGFALDRPTLSPVEQAS